MFVPMVSIEQGKLRGKLGVDYNGRNFCIFQGIPYAKPPIGDLRFKAPQPPEPWSGIFDATKEGSESISKHILFQHDVGSEDCLHLNVYTPELPKSGSTRRKLLPVMVYIHGGYFMTGSNKTDCYGPEFLITEDVVLVTINYRLGILGFLSLEDPSLEVPGNAGLKDMVLALKWIQNNIKPFGGNPNNVTIFGESAGAVAVNLLMLSPKATGLFHRAIMQSGASLCPWAITLNKPFLYVEKLGKHATSEKEVLDILKSVPANEFNKIQTLIKQADTVNNLQLIGAVIEKPNPDAFLTEHPLDVMQSGNYNKVPLIIGYCSREGIVLELNDKLVLHKKTEYRPNNFQDTIPHYYNIEKNSPLSESIGQLIEEFYFGDSKSQSEDEVADNFYTLHTDTIIARGVHLTFRVLLKTLNQPIYFYTFHLQTGLNIYKNLGHVTKEGACHADDLGYLFKTIMTPAIKPNSQEEKSMKIMVNLWGNFARTGDPNPEDETLLINIVWPKVTKELFCSLKIDNKLTVEVNPEEKRMQFWDLISKQVNSLY